MASAPHPTEPLALKLLHSADPARRGEVVRFDDELIIGRANAVGQTIDGVDFGLPDKLLSRQHVTLRRADNGQLLIIDHDSRNGSFLQGRRVSRARASEGAVLRLGVNVFVVCTSDESSEVIREEVGIDDIYLVASQRGRQLDATLHQLANTSGRVAFVGGPGAGKVLCGRVLHARRHKDAPLQRVLCAQDSRTVAAELFESSSDRFKLKSGSILLQQVDLLSLSLQARIVRAAADDNPVDLMATSDTTLSAACKVGAVRPELLQFFEMATVQVPTLSARKAGLVAFFSQFLEHSLHDTGYSWSGTFMEKLLLYHWPKNIRELRVVTTRLANTPDGSKVLRSAHLPEDLRRAVKVSKEALNASTVSLRSPPARRELADLLTKFQGDAERVCDHYGIERNDLYRFLSRHDLSLADYAADGERA